MIKEQNENIFATKNTVHQFWKFGCYFIVLITIIFSMYMMLIINYQQSSEWRVRNLFINLFDI